jgi:hypothetical protein
MGRSEPSAPDGVTSLVPTALRACVSTALRACVSTALRARVPAALPARVPTALSARLATAATMTAAAPLRERRHGTHQRDDEHPNDPIHVGLRIQVRARVKPSD